MQKITPHIWFDTQAEDAVNFYVSIFPNSKVLTTSRYTESGAKMSGQPEGALMTTAFELDGYKMMAINAGPVFQINPSVSFMLNFDPSKDANAEANLESMWSKLSEGGNALMELGEYPFSKKYGWIKDRFGVTWQLILTNPEGEERPFIIPSLMFVGANAGRAEEATDFYASLFQDSGRGTLARYPAGMEPDKEGSVMFTDFRLANQWFAAMDSAHKHEFAFNEAVSLMVDCKDQAEIDYFWENLTKEGEEQPCGWLKDRYGLSWQIVPSAMGEIMNQNDPSKTERVMAAMMSMKKLDVATLRAAADGE